MPVYRQLLARRRVRLFGWAALVVLIPAALTACARSDGAALARRSEAAALRGGKRQPPPVSPAPIAPLPKSPSLDPSVVRLGKSLFHDRRLSRHDDVACSTCHRLRHGGDDGRRVSVGTGGAAGIFNTPTVFNAGFDFIQSWDGRADTLEGEIAAEIRNPRELGTSPEAVRRKLAADPMLVSRFDKTFGSGLTGETIVSALATYVRALSTPGAPFDRYLAGDADAIGPAARRGYTLFQNLGCLSCHQGRNLGGNLFEPLGVMAEHFGSGRAPTRADYGRYNVTGREQDCYVFKVPSLRNVAQTAPYLHDGSAATLQAAVRIMAKYEVGTPVSEGQVRALTAFLRSLSGHVDGALL